MPTVPSVSISTFQVQKASQRALDLVGAPGEEDDEEKRDRVTGRYF